MRMRGALPALAKEHKFDRSGGSRTRRRGGEDSEAKGRGLGRILQTEGKEKSSCSEENTGAKLTDALDVGVQTV